MGDVETLRVTLRIFRHPQTTSGRTPLNLAINPLDPPLLGERRKCRGAAPLCTPLGTLSCHSRAGGNPDRSSEGHVSSWPQNPGQEPWIASFARDILPLAHGSKGVIKPPQSAFGKGGFREFSEVRDNHLT
jgi:hypothetical protein